MEKINLLIAGLALSLSIVVAYWQFFRRPKLKIFYEDKEPFRKYLPLLEEKPVQKLEWFIRVKVQNNRKIIAKTCFGKIIEWYTNGEKVEKFDPIRLHWVSNPPTDKSSVNLSYMEFDYIDIFYTNYDLNRIFIYTHTHPRGTPIYFNLNDIHHIKIVVYCENEAYRFFYLKIWLDANRKVKLNYPQVKAISQKEYNKLL